MDLKSKNIELKVLASNCEVDESTNNYPTSETASIRVYIFLAGLKRLTEGAGNNAEQQYAVHRDSLNSQQRALRAATWLSTFYLIMTDILGPQNAPYAIAQVGYVSGCCLYLVFGLAAFWTGLLLRSQFLALDSYQYPVKTFSDLVFRIFGRAAAHFVNVLQCIQILFIISVIVLSSGQALSQTINLDRLRLCFSVCILVWIIAGSVVSQIRSLNKFSRISQIAIYINVLVIIITIVGVAKYPPNYSAVRASYGLVEGPIVHTNFGTASTLPLRVNGAMQMVFAYGGSMLFVEFMAEMRRPTDFWKALICAQVLIVVLYLSYGLVCYTLHGQFVFNPANQGISKYSLLTASNIISMVGSVIASSLYANVGVKVIYQKFVVAQLRGPDLLSTQGRIIWTFLVILYWFMAFFVAACIPNVSTLSGVVATGCILQFSYTFPPLMALGLAMQRDAAAADVFDETTLTVRRIDTWQNLSRWRRALSTGRALKTFYFVFFLAACTVTGLGLWASVESVKEAFRKSAATVIGCTPPV